MLLDLIVVTLGCFVAAYINAAFSVGGGYVILASIYYSQPVIVAIQLHPALALVSLITRMVFFWRNIDWGIAKSFILGAILGITIGSKLLISLPTDWLSLAVGFLMLGLLWLPKLHGKLFRPKAFVAIGCIHAFISTLLAIGSLMQSCMLRTKLERDQIIGTLSSCLLVMSLFKVFAYQLQGFHFENYWPYVLCASFAGVLGVWCGKHANRWLSEDLFRRVYSLTISTFAGILIYRGILGIVIEVI